VTEASLTRRGAATRQKLLTAAADELIERDGALEVASVARRAEVSVGLLYRYFGSKAGLVAAVVDDFYDRLLAETGDVRDAGDTWAARERRRLELSVAFHYREPLAEVILSRLAREPEVASVEVQRIARIVTDAARSIQRGQRRGELPEDVDARLAGAMMIGAFRVTIGEALTRRSRPDEQALCKEIWRFVAHGARAAVPDED
jgi:AcrR family transcriptional regulator